ncbi:hypothetical protein OV207_18635 [Corallococcus sp. BB11-1]|uniref:hypothetical protein n=1 Tax=Corallococcus sp. BB11-1 TaxID=2996783 RepID=UPI0010E8563A|nr:hypothetical protein [Corallococcus sp. BB11-1]MCY1033476.1 hypothetical protein [Corallococcus sp. BB11-1]RYZ46858.1 MAG: hypothetical protein EOO72_00995 [Myxococcaceae bacterium]
MSTSRLWPFVGVAILSGAAGFGAAAWLGPAEGRAVQSGALERQEARFEEALRKLEACQPTTEAPPMRATVAVDTSGLREEIRQILKEELRAATSAPTPPAPEPRPPQPTPQSVAAFSQGRRLVENAVATGRWSEAQRDELRSLLSQLTPEQRQEIIRTLVVNINGGKVKVDLVGAPF